MRAWNPWICVAINQLAFPGMGTVMAGRRIGYVQAAIMVAGFCLLTGFIIWFFVCLFRYQLMEVPDKVWFTAEWQRYGWAGRWGGGLCLTAWCWALVSSVRVLRDDRKRKEQLPR